MDDGDVAGFKGGGYISWRLYPKGGVWASDRGLGDVLELIYGLRFIADSLRTREVKLLSRRVPRLVPSGRGT